MRISDELLGIKFELGTPNFGYTHLNISQMLVDQESGEYEIISNINIPGISYFSNPAIDLLTALDMTIKEKQRVTVEIECEQFGKYLIKIAPELITIISDGDTIELSCSISSLKTARKELSHRVKKDFESWVSFDGFESEEENLNRVLLSELLY